MKKPDFDFTALKTQIQEQPLLAAGIGAAILSGGAKFLNAVSASKNSKTWRQEVKRRRKKDSKKK